MLKLGRYWPWKTVWSHFHMPVRPILLHRPSFLFDCFVNGLPPPLAKNSPYAYVSWYVSCERNIHSSASKRPISEAQFKNCWIVTARSRSLTESLKIPLVRQNWGRPYTACKEYYNVYVAWIHVHIKSQISISNLYFNTVKIHQVFCYI